MDQSPNDNSIFATEICKLIVIGLEGVGKTTLINEVCGENFETSDGTGGCLVKNNQKGSFLVDGFRRRYELIDMLGVNYQKPGEWQRTLHERSDVHGVIFFLFGSNPRNSAQGELPRIAEYCSNLGIPVLYIYRDGVLGFDPHIKIDAETVECEIQGAQTASKFKRYSNLDQVKRFIAEIFQGAQKLHQLLDPITICGQVKELREGNQELQMKLKSLRQKLQAERNKQKEELNHQKQDYNDEIARFRRLLDEATQNNKSLEGELKVIAQRNQESVNELGNKIQASIVENQHLRKSCDSIKVAMQELKVEHLELIKDKQRVDMDLHSVSLERQQLHEAKRSLENDIAELNAQKHDLVNEKNLLERRVTHLRRRINEMRSYLEERLDRMVHVVQSAPNERKEIRSKKYNAGNKWMWLPGRAYDVMERFDELGSNVKEVIRHLRRSLQTMGIAHDQQPDPMSDDEDN